jgi:hypothetical protein
VIVLIKRTCQSIKIWKFIYRLLCSENKDWKQDLLEDNSISKNDSMYNWHVFNLGCDNYMIKMKLVNKNFFHDYSWIILC